MGAGPAGLSSAKQLTNTGFSVLIIDKIKYQALISGSEIGKMILNKDYFPVQLNEIISRKQREIRSLFPNQEKGKWSR